MCSKCAEPLCSHLALTALTHAALPRRHLIARIEGTVLPTSFSRTTRSLAQDSARYALLSWAFGGVCLLALGAWFVLAKVELYELSTHARLEVKRSAHPLSAQVAGKVVSTALQLGQEVQEGQVLLTLDARNATLRLHEEEARLTAIPPQIALLEKQIAALEQAKGQTQQAAQAAAQTAHARQAEANAALSFAKDNANRLTQLSDLGQIPLIETLKARAEAEKLSANSAALSADIQRLGKEAQTRAHQHQAEIEHLKGEIAALHGQFSIAQQTVSRLQQDIANHVLRAPVQGQIADVALVPVGAYVAIGDKLGSVVPHSELRIIAAFPPASVFGRIHPGQSARMRLDAFPWTQFGTVNAKVASVAAEIRDNEVRVEFTPELAAQSPITLQHGLPGRMEVIIEQVTPAVLSLRAAGQLLADTPVRSKP